MAVLPKAAILNGLIWPTAKMWAKGPFREREFRDLVNWYGGGAPMPAFS